MLKVQIKDPKSGFRMNLPVPYHLFINIFVRRSIALKIAADRARDGDPRTAKILETIGGIDFDLLRHALHQLGSYPSLHFVDIEAADGTVVKIKNT